MRAVSPGSLVLRSVGFDRAAQVCGPVRAPLVAVAGFSAWVPVEACGLARNFA